MYLITIHFSLFICSGVLKAFSKGSSCHSRFVQPISRLLSHSSHFIQPVHLSFKLFYGVSFEWALTHRSFPRILPDSSYFPGGILKFLSKFDVRMSYHQSNVFLQDLSNSFHRWLNLSILHLGVPQQFLVVFPVVILRFLKTEEEFLFNLAPFSLRFVILACCHPLVIVLIVRILFTYPE